MCIYMANNEDNTFDIDSKSYLCQFFSQYL